MIRSSFDIIITFLLLLLANECIRAFQLVSILEFGKASSFLESPYFSLHTCRGQS